MRDDAVLAGDGWWAASAAAGARVARRATDGRYPGAVALVARTKLFKLAESLGGVESLIELPARMTHASTAEAPFAAPLNLIRLSVGLESPEDLLEDLELALAPVGTRSARSV